MEATITNSSNVGQSSFCPSLIFTDDSEVSGVSGAVGGGPTCLFVSGGLPNGTATVYFFRARANTPILFSTYGKGVSPVPPFAYSVYIVMEQL